MEILTILLVVLMTVYVLFKITKAMHMLQQNLYNENNRYLKWVVKNINHTFFNTNMIAIIFTFILMLSIMKELRMVFLVILCLIYLLAFCYDYYRSKGEQNKKPLVYTARIKRLLVTIVILYSIPLIIFLINNSLIDVSLFVYSILVTCVFFVIFLANIINFPVERMVYHHFERKAKAKLRSMPNLKVVGVTGSYGKTSSKNILNDILNIKYNSLATPKSLNTFNGLMITVNNKLSKFDDVFIAEMGAYVKGEINGLCKLVNPSYGIITSICCLQF